MDSLSHTNPAHNEALENQVLDSAIAASHSESCGCHRIDTSMAYFWTIDRPLVMMVTLITIPCFAIFRGYGIANRLFKASVTTFSLP